MEPHNARSHPLGHGQTMSAAKAASIAGACSDALIPHQRARCAAPRPMAPQLRSRGTPTDGTVSVGTVAYMLPDAHGCAPYGAGSWASTNLTGSPPAIEHVSCDPRPLVLRADIARPEHSRLEHASSVLRALAVPAAARSDALEAVARALSGGSAVAWLSAVVAACADLACDQQGAYPDATSAAASYWSAPPLGLVVMCVEAWDWQVLSALGQAGDVVVRAHGLDDRRALRFAACVARSARHYMPAPGDVAPVPALRRCDWAGASRFIFVVPPGTTTPAQRADFSAGSWAASVPPADAWDSASLAAQLAAYSAQYGLEDDLHDAMCAVEMFSAPVLGAPPVLSAALRAVRLPRPFGLQAVLGELLAPTPADPYRAVGAAGLPDTAAGWVSGLALGPLALLAAALALARDAGADPAGLARADLAHADLAASAAGAGGDANLLARMVGHGYGIAAPFGLHFGPQRWVGAAAPSAGRAPSHPALEAVAKDLFGTAAAPDTITPPMGLLGVGAMNGVGYGLLVSPGSAAHTQLATPGLWDSTGLAPLGAPMWVRRVARTVADSASDAAAMHAWEQLDPATAAGLGELYSPGPALPGSLGLPPAQHLPFLRSACEPTEEWEVALLWPANSADIAAAAAEALRAHKWRLGVRLAAMGLGRGSSMPPPVVPVAAPGARRRRLLEAMMSASAASSAAAADSPSLRESVVPTPGFGGPGPDQRISLTGPGVAPPAAEARVRQDHSPVRERAHGAPDVPPSAAPQERGADSGGPPG